MVSEEVLSADIMNVWLAVISRRSMVKVFIIFFSSSFVCCLNDLNEKRVPCSHVPCRKFLSNDEMLSTELVFCSLVEAFQRFQSSLRIMHLG